MKEDLIADIWNIVIERIPEKLRKDTAADFVNVLLDYSIKESVLESLMGVDPYLDDAISYATDGDKEEEEYYEDEDEE